MMGEKQREKFRSEKLWKREKWLKNRRFFAFFFRFLASFCPNTCKTLLNVVYLHQKWLFFALFTDFLPLFVKKFAKRLENDIYLQMKFNNWSF